MSSSSLESITKPRFLPAYDAVVIGTGMGGLMAGIQMSLRGKKVLVLEQHNLPGGFATTFVRGRYEFEATLHELLDFDTPENKGPIRKLLEDAGVDYELNRVPEAYVIVLPNEKINVKVPFGVDNFIDVLEKEVPGVRPKLTKYMNLCKDIFEAMRYLASCSENGEKPSKIKMMTKYKNFLKYGYKTVEEVEEEFNFPKRAKSILYAYWCYQGPSCDRLTFTTWAYMIYGYLTTGAYVPTKRSHTLACSMTKRIRELGGQVEFNCKVEKINVKDKRVVSIKLDSGEEIKTNYVFSNAHPEVVFGKMISPKEEIPEFSIKKLNSKINSCSAVTLYLGLNANPEEMGIKYYEYFIGDTMNTKEIHDGFFTLDAPKFHSAICLDNAVKGATGKGRCQLSMTGLVMGDAFKDVTPENYQEVKDKFADSLINQFINATGADIRNHIEEVEMVTPETWNRYTGAYKGQVFGYEQTPWDAVIFRGATVNEERKLEIEGLDFVGGCSTSAHAYSCTMKSGLMAAKRTLKKMEADK